MKGVKVQYSAGVQYVTGPVSNWSNQTSPEKVIPTTAIQARSQQLNFFSQKNENFKHQNFWWWKLPSRMGHNPEKTNYQNNG